MITGTQRLLLCIAVMLIANALLIAIVMDSREVWGFTSAMINVGVICLSFGLEGFIKK